MSIGQQRTTNARKPPGEERLRDKLTISGSPGDRTQKGVVLISYLIIFGVLLCCFVLWFSLRDQKDVSGAGVGLTAFLLFAAGAAVGAVVGFLFGLPRARFADASQSNPQNPTAVGSTSEAGRSAHYLTNSNLIKVSDWLTTIIIGLGLVNLAKIGPAASSLRTTLEEPLGGTAYSGIIGVSMIIIALLSSMILCYLWTSIRVRELLEDAEDEEQEDAEAEQAAAPAS
jgi:hypothetical protein